MEKEKKDHSLLWTLFTSLFSLSAFTFGGGYVIVPLMEKKYVEELKWINEEEILIHTGNDSSEAISRFHIYTGELTPVFSEETFMLYIGFSPDKKRLLIQKAQDDQTELVVLSIDGDVIQERVIDTHGYVTADWNPEKPNLILLAYHYETENAEEIIVEKWDIEDNSAVVIEGSSLDIQWYSANLYVYVQVDG